MNKEKDIKTADRRKQVRSCVYGFLHTTATLKNYPAGILADISAQGAQIIVPYDSHNHPVENQNIRMEIKTTIEHLNTSLNVLVKSVTITEDKNLRIGVCFTDLSANPQAQSVIKRIYEYGQKLKAAGE